MWRVGVTVWATVESGRIIGTLLTVFLQKTIMRSCSLDTSEKNNRLRIRGDSQHVPGVEHEIIEPRRSEIRGPLGSFGDC